MDKIKIGKAGEAFKEAKNALETLEKVWDDILEAQWREEIDTERQNERVRDIREALKSGDPDKMLEECYSCGAEKWKDKECISPSCRGAAS